MRVASSIAAAAGGRSRRRIGIALVLACLKLPAAGGPLQDHALNNAPWSWGIWGTTAVSQIKEGGQSYKRVTISPAPANAWDVGIYITLQKPVKKGDVVVLGLRVRTEKLSDGNEFAPLVARVFATEAKEVSVVPETNFMAGHQWKWFLASGTADRNYEPGQLSGGVRIGSGEQTLDIAEVIIAGFPPDFDVSTLPTN